jgi:hypothetical protein
LARAAAAATAAAVELSAAARPALGAEAEAEAAAAVAAPAAAPDAPTGLLESNASMRAAGPPEPGEAGSAEGAEEGLGGGDRDIDKGRPSSPPLPPPIVVAPTAAAALPSRAESTFALFPATLSAPAAAAAASSTVPPAAIAASAALAAATAAAAAASARLFAFRRALCASSFSRQLRRSPSNSPRGWKRPHCWQKRHLELWWSREGREKCDELGGAKRKKQKLKKTREGKNKKSPTHFSPDTSSSKACMCGWQTPNLL